MRSELNNQAFPAVLFTAIAIHLWWHNAPAEFLLPAAVMALWMVAELVWMVWRSIRDAGSSSTHSPR